MEPDWRFDGSQIPDLRPSEFLTTETGALSFNHTGIRRPLARPWRGRGRRATHPLGAAEGRAGPCPAAGTHLHSGFCQIEPHGQLLPGGDTDGAVSPGHLEPPAPEIPVPEASGAGPRADTTCRRPRPGSGPPSWAPLGTLRVLASPPRRSPNSASSSRSCRVGDSSREAPHGGSHFHN